MGNKRMKPGTLDDLTAHWTKVAQDALLGRKIVEVRYMTRDEADDSGYDSRPLIIVLDNNQFLFAMRDPEGNDAGAMALGANDTLPSLP